MKRLLVLGGGTAGTMVVNKLRRRLPAGQWQITVVDQNDTHVYQPGFLFIPFGAYSPAQVVKPRRRFIPRGVELVSGEIDRVDTAANTVVLADGRELGYDYLVIATGTSPRPDQTPGMLGPLWRVSIFDFYTLDGATALARALTPILAQRVRPRFDLAIGAATRTRSGACGCPTRGLGSRRVGRLGAGRVSRCVG